MTTFAQAGPSTKPLNVLYCGVCSLPVEYCEFGSSFSKCKAWLEEEDEQEYRRLYSEGEWCFGKMHGVSVTVD
jgi:hypothetical protein